MKKIKFKSPVNKGETFTIKELLDINENQTLFEEWLDYELSENLKERKNLIDQKSKEETREEIARLKTQQELDNQKYLLREKDILEKTARADVAQEMAKIKADLSSSDVMNQKILNEKDNRIKEKDEHIKKQNELLDKNNFTLNRMQDTINDIDEKNRKHYDARFDEAIQNKTKEFEDKRVELELSLKSANKIGEDAENEIREQLSNLFPEDKISKPNHAIGGADVFQQIYNNKNKEIGTIYYEVKNKKTWSYADYKNFADKTRDRSDDINIYIAKSLPKTSKEKHLQFINSSILFDKVSNIYLVDFDSYLSLVFGLRTSFVEYKTKLNNESKKESLQKNMYDFITSSEFGNYFSVISTHTREIEKIFKEIQSNTIKGVSENNNIEIQIKSLIKQIDNKKNS